MSFPLPVDSGKQHAGGPLVSVVVPLFNGEAYVRESLDSILAQTYRNIEVIVMDDASTDGAPDVVRSYEDERLQYLRQPENRGIFANINAGIARARGEFVAIHHADDVYSSEILQREVEFLREHPHTGAVFAIDTFIDGGGRVWGRLELPDELRGQKVLAYPVVLNGMLRHKNIFIRGGTSLIRRSVYEEVGVFDDAYLLRADLDLWLRIARLYPIGLIEEHLVAYRYGHDNASARYDRLRSETELTFAVLDRHLAEGGRAVAAPDALRALEGHKAEDRLMVAINLYILDRSRDARDMLQGVARPLAATSRVQRVRLLALWAALTVFVRLPRSSFVAAAFLRRWHGGAG